MRSSAYPVTIWTDPVGALDAGDEAAEWLTRFLGISVRLVAKDDNSVRPVVKNAPTATEVGFQPEVGLFKTSNKLDDMNQLLHTNTQTAFADAFPILLVSETSLADINTQLPDTSQQVTTRNFRPNIVVRGCSAPYEEETWKQVAVGAPEQEAIWHVACRCIRCSVPTIDPETGVKSADGQPQKLIQEVRR
ncbi:MOSC domain-containing protein [Jimgerdemannia flammicorona]|nr:MOSC domain-containing protein [Jimgerdemannia flammicorona]